MFDLLHCITESESLIRIGVNKRLRFECFYLLIMNFVNISVLIDILKANIFILKIKSHCVHNSLWSHGVSDTNILMMHERITVWPSETSIWR